MGETNGSNVGKSYLTYIIFGGLRDVRKTYIDPMALVQRFEKSDIFLTMMCNPNWQ